MNNTCRGDARLTETTREWTSAATLDELPQRIRDIATLRGLGYSFRQISEQFEVTPQAISLMLSRHRRVLRRLRGSVELAGLSARAVNALGRHGIRSRAAAFETDVLELLKGERNCGKKTLEEIRRWIDDAATGIDKAKPIASAKHRRTMAAMREDSVLKSCQPRHGMDLRLKEKSV